jgi:hypothetical protein
MVQDQRYMISARSNSWIKADFCGPIGGYDLRRRNGVPTYAASPTALCLGRCATFTKNGRWPGTDLHISRRDLAPTLPTGGLRRLGQVRFPVPRESSDSYFLIDKGVLCCAAKKLRAPSEHGAPGVAPSGRRSSMVEQSRDTRQQCRPGHRLWHIAVETRFVDLRGDLL